MNITIQKKYLIEEMQQNASRFSQTVKRSIDYEMLTAQSNYIQKTLEDIGTQEGIEHIRILDKEGRIYAADSKEEVGKFIDRQAEACYSCHSNKDPLKKLSTPVKTRIFKSDKGYRLLGIINPIYNEPKCYNSECHFHPKEQHVLGVMDILTSLAHFDNQIGTSQRQILLYFLFTFLLISVGTALFILLFVDTPIHKLIEGTRKIAKGDFDYRIGHYYSDEIGELGKSFDWMSAELKKYHEEIEQWNLKLKSEVKKATEKLRKTNEKLNNANRKLQQLDNLKSDFMRKMEHGLRSHLSIMKSCLSLTRGENFTELNEQQKDLIKTAERRSSMLLEMLDDILLLSYRQSPGTVYRMEPVLIADVIQRVLDDIQTQVEKKKIVVDIQIPVDSPHVLADRNALYEIFANLLTNAVKYTGEQGVINVKAEQKKGFIEVDVSDTGIGITSEDIAHIFNEFYRAPNAKSYKIEGTGLGLAIVKEIVQAHQGSITVQSASGKGSTFRVVLPMANKQKKRKA